MTKYIFLSYLIVLLIIVMFISQIVIIFYKCYIDPIANDLQVDLYQDQPVYQPVSSTINPPINSINYSLELKEVLNSNTDCPICLDAINLGVEVKCGHIFHHDCIKKWITTDFTGNKKCPLCRTKLRVMF